MAKEKDTSKKKNGIHLHGAKEIGNDKKQSGDSVSDAISMKRRGQANKKSA